MNTVMRSVCSNFSAELAVVVATLLAGCGGGGGSSAPPAPTTVTVTCPDGTKQTAATADAANTACPAPTLISITPKNGATGVSIDPFGGVVVATSSSLDATTLTTANIKMSVGNNTPLAGTITASADGKGFTFMPTAKPSYFQAYNFTANVKDTLGKSLAISGSLTTASITCVLPQVPDTAGTSCVTPQPTVLHYTDKVFVIWTGGQINAVTKTSVTLLANKTQYTVGTWPLFNCWLPKSNVGVLADGTILASCQDAVSLSRHYLYIDPIKGEIHEYVGQTPASLTCTENADKTWTCPASHDWLSVQVVPPSGAPSDAATAAQVSDGWYFNTNASPRSTFFVDSSGNTTTVKAGVSGTDGLVNLFMAFSH